MVKFILKDSPSKPFFVDDIVVAELTTWIPAAVLWASPSLHLSDSSRGPRR
jgi:hypothetical protein